MAAAAHAAEGKQYFPLAGGAQDGWHRDGRATATCYCGAVQLSFPTEGPGVAGCFVCNCSDCHKFSATMFASNFTIVDDYLTHERGRDNLTVYTQNKTIGSGKNMGNYFCKTCGSLMYRVGEDFPGLSILRMGTLDDFTLMETKLKPQVEQYVEERASWLSPVKGVKQVKGLAFSGKSSEQQSGSSNL